MKKIMFLAIAIVGLVSCNSDNGGEDKPVDNFDRGAMLVNWADNIIIPSFEAFAAETQNFKDATAAFTAAPSEATLASLRAAYREAYLQYQTVAMFEMGEAENIYYHDFLNIYPTDTTGIQTKIESNDYDLELTSSRDQQGFPAVDFLLNGLGETDAEILSYYTSHANADIYNQYLTDVVSRIDTLTGVVLADWQNSYRDTFVSSTSSSSTGSVDRFTNDFVMYFEMDLRSGKIGYPAGTFTGNPAPELTEAFYSEDFSKQLYLKSLEAFQSFFNGEHFNGTETGPSYKQYLEYLNSIREGEDIAAAINGQLAVVFEQSSSLNADLAEQVRTNNTLMLGAFEELQKVVVLLKVDMLQALNVSVDYVDSDGD